MYFKCTSGLVGCTSTVHLGLLGVLQVYIWGLGPILVLFILLRACWVYMILNCMSCIGHVNAVSWCHDVWAPQVLVVTLVSVCMLICVLREGTSIGCVAFCTFFFHSHALYFRVLIIKLWFLLLLFFSFLIFVLMLLLYRPVSMSLTTPSRWKVRKSCLLSSIGASIQCVPLTMMERLVFWLCDLVQD